MYEPPAEDERPGCRDTIVLTRAVFATLLPMLAVVIGLLGLVALAFYLFALHPALTLIPLALMVAGVLAFIRWERDRFRSPGG